MMDKMMMDKMRDIIPGLLCIDTDGKITYVNKQMERYRCCTAEEMIGKHIKELFPHTKMMDTLERKLDHRMVLYQGGEATSKDLCEASIHKLLIEDGKVTGLMTYDLFQNVFELEQFLQMYISLDDSIKYRRNELKKFQTTKYSIDDIIGRSSEIVQMKNDIRRASYSNSTVLITGETGTGKELVAHAIHSLSKRCMNNFVKLSITSLPDSLIESELFGYEKGSFTGASSTGKVGRFEAADRGTLFIDEIETLSLSIQPKLLRVLQEKEIDKIGRNVTFPVDVRIVTATNVDLEDMVKENKFRQDLYYRLDVVEIKVPPLRKRKVDVPYLVENFISKFNAVMETDIYGISEDALIKLQNYDWPGNVRELKNVIERAMNITGQGVIGVDAIRFSDKLHATFFDMEDYNIEEYENPIEDIKKKFERQVIGKALERCNGSKTEAAKLLKISRPLLYQKMDRLKMK